MNPLVKMHLHMLRQMCITMITAIDLILVDDIPVEPPPVEDKDKRFDFDPLKCQHPRSHWQHTPAMGHPNRMICRCGETMEE